ncbi:MAG TPA: sugar phosphate nucleotidyltransferase [Gemmatimonadales bacterium]|nr:sugar phosphate nucleotidyltransferase [Gemmatimonadales bacterium]
MSRWAAVLAGGSGTRFWPLSTPAHPKQMLALTGDAPLLVQAVRRLEGLVPPERVFIVTGAALADETRRLLPALPADHVLTEPRAASTAPALVWATQEIRRRDPDAAVLSLHADWWVGDDARFRDTAARALDVAERHDVLVTVGVVPTRPDTGYGYIEPGEPLDGDVRAVKRFTEKPDAETAERLVASGALWNSGLFAWTAARLFTETAALAPEIAPHLALLERGDVPGFFAAVTPVAIDVSHFERSQRVAVVPGAFPWDDVGTWAALARVRTHDAAGNVSAGEVVAHEASDCVAWADDGALVLDGVHDLVVVRANGITLVTTRDRAPQLKDLLAVLPESLRTLKR